jgi:alkylation response protein AidB-like acyl-CoA dehydrogenase
MAKMAASTYALEISSEAIQLYGGYGYMTEYEVESYYRDAKVAQVFQGSRNSLKNNIAKAVIGRIK